MIILICEEYSSRPGGVAYFSDVLAKKYHREGELKGVISLSPDEPAARNFPVEHILLSRRSYGKMPLDQYPLTRKINSLFFKVYIGLTGGQWKPVLKALKALEYRPGEDVLFFTYQVHFPDLFSRLYRHYGGEQWILYHGLDLLGFKNHPQKVQQNTRVAGKVIFNSRATQQLFGDLGYTAGKQEVIHPFLDEEYLESLDLLTLAEMEQRTGLALKDQIIITSICRLVRRKGIHFALEIVEELVRQGRPIQYLIGGTGPELERLKNLVEEKGLTSTVHFLGYVDDLLKYSILNISKVFLMPNYDDGGDDFEGFGISFLEAGYYDNLVIGGKHGGAEEALEMISNGYSFLYPENISFATTYIKARMNEKVNNPSNK